MSEQNVENVAETLAEYERLAIKTGAKVQIMPPEFTADGKEWSALWLDDEAPAAARARVFRDDVQTEVIATWRESLPLETSLTADGRRWCEIWARKPMQRLGSYVLRAALSRAFRDAIGDRHEPEDDVPRIADNAPRDFEAELTAAPDVVSIDAIWAQARVERARTGALEALYKRRRLEMVQQDWHPFSAEQAPADELSPEEAVKHRAFFPEDYEPVEEQVQYDDGSYSRELVVHPPVSARDRAYGATPRMPEDYKQPMNRAARRANRKGRR